MCTPIMNDMVDEPNAREWVRVTTNVQILAWLMLIPSAAYTVFVIVAITCCWRKTVRREVKKQQVKTMYLATTDSHEPHPDQKKKRGITLLLVRALFYLKGSQSPWFYRFLFAWEAREIVFQFLAIGVSNYRINL